MADVPVAATDSAPSPSWIPSRKVLSQGVGGVITFLIMTAARHFLGFDLPASVETVVLGAVMWAIGYLVPPSVRDVVNHLNDGIVKFAQEDPTSPVTKAGTS